MYVFCVSCAQAQDSMRFGLARAGSLEQKKASFDVMASVLWFFWGYMLVCCALAIIVTSFA